MRAKEKERWLGAVRAIQEEAELVERLLTDPPRRLNAPELANEMRISGGVIRNLAAELTLSALDKNK